MNSHRHDEYQRRQWVQDKLQKRKRVKQILQEAQISRATLYNWIDEFSQQSIVNSRQENIQPSSIAHDFNRGEDGENHSEEIAPIHSSQFQPGETHLPEKNLPIHHSATRQRMLLAALEKIDADKAIAKKLVATLVKRFTLSVAQACDMVGLDESIYEHKPRKPEVDDRLVQQSIVQLLAENPTRSFEQCSIELRTLHPHWTRKQIKRVYREGRLYLQRRRPRRSGQPDGEVPGFPVHPQRPGAIWNIGAIPLAELADGWLFFLLDDADALLLNSETLPQAFAVEQLTAFLQKAIEENGKPRRLRLPDKPPFPVKELSRWALQNRLSVVTLSMSKPENEMEMQAMETAVKSIAESKMAGSG